MIIATSTIKNGSSLILVPGLLLLRTEKIPEFGYRNGFVVNTRLGKRLIVADLHNEVFPLNLKTIVISGLGVYLVVNDFALFQQEDSLKKDVNPHFFLTSQKRVSCRKFDPNDGIMLEGSCHRFFDGDQDLFIDQFLTTASQS